MRRPKGERERPAKALSVSERVFVDLLDLENEVGMGDTLERRIQHLDYEQQVVVLSQALGLYVLTVQQVRKASPSAAAVLRTIRFGATKSFVMPDLPTE